MGTALRYISDECWVIPTGSRDDPTSIVSAESDPATKPETVAELDALLENHMAESEAYDPVQVCREALKRGAPGGSTTSTRPNRRRQKRAWLRLARLASWLPRRRPKPTVSPATEPPSAPPNANTDSAKGKAGSPDTPAPEEQRRSRPKPPSTPDAKASRVLRRKYKHSKAKEARQQLRSAAVAEPQVTRPKDRIHADEPRFEPDAGHTIRSDAHFTEPLATLEARVNLQLDVAEALKSDAKKLSANGESRRPVAVIEVTNKVIGDFFYLRPDDAVADLICGVLGRALEKTGVGLVALHVLSNHVGMLLTVHSCSQLASLMHRFNQQTSHRIGRHLNLPTRLWAGRYHAVVLTGDAGIQLNRLGYCLGNGTKENLVAHPSQWPGVHSARYFCNNEVLAGHWTDFTSYGKALRRDPKARIEDHQTRYVLKHTKLPCFEHLSDAEYKALAVAQCDDIAERMARERSEGRLGPAAGPEGLRRVSIYDRPENPARSPRPPVHSLDPAAKRRFRAAYKNYVTHHQAVRASLTAGLKVLSADFAGGILPTGWEPADPASVVAPPTMAISEAIEVT